MPLILTQLEISGCRLRSQLAPSNCSGLKRTAKLQVTATVCDGTLGNKSKVDNNNQCN